MVEQFANNADSTLNGAIDNVTTTIVVVDGSVFPSTGNFRLIFGTDPDTAEYVIATARSGNTITLLGRGAEGSTAQSWGNGTIVTHIVTAGAIITLRDTLKGNTLHSSLETISSPEDGYALTWVNTDGYWAARPGSQWTTANATEIYTTKTVSIDENGTTASQHGDGYSKLYINGKVLATSISAGEIPLTVRGFGYVSDAIQTFTVPEGVTSLRVKMWGPGGGSGNYAGANGGGPGGFSSGILSVTPGEVLQLVVGSGGEHPVSATGNGGLGGWPGGGFGARGDASGAGGGGFTGIFNTSMTQDNALIIAGGGGGATGYSGGNSAGAGGGLTAGGGVGTNGRGGTQSAGGADGNNNAAASTTIAAGSNGASLPQGTINVASTTPFPTSGILLITTDAGIQIVAHTGKNATQFTGCTGGTGTMSTGGAVIYAIAGSALTGGIPHINNTASTGSDSGGGGSGYFGGGAGQGDGRSGGGGSGFLHATRVTNGVTTTGTNANVNGGSTLPPNTTDVNYIAGIGIGGAATGAAGTDGGDGYIVFIWGGITTLDFDSIDFGNTSSISTIDTNITISPATNGIVSLSAAGASGSVTLNPITSGLITLSSSSDIAFTSGTSSVLFNMNSAQKFKIYSSGAIVVGGADTQNDTSSEAQAGLTGPLINLSSSTGTFTSNTNQALIFNQSGALNLQGNTEVRFNTGSTFRGYFDSNGIFRSGPSASSGATLSGASAPFVGSDYFYMYNSSGSSWAEIIAGGSVHRAALQVLSNATSNTCGVSLFAGAPSHATPEYAGNGTIEQFGNSASALVFTKRNGTDGLSFASTGAIWQSGAWTIGRTTNNDTSSEAQAGLTGPLLNIAQTTGGSLTTVANQALLYNAAGVVTLQGNAGHNFITGTTSVASTTATKFITSLGRRLGITTVGTNVTVPDGYDTIFVPTLTAGITITLPSTPANGDTYLIKDRDGSASTFNIIISGNGKNIEQFVGAPAASLTLNQNYDSVTLIYNGTFWSII